MNEFVKNDVLVEIGNNKKLFWIVREVTVDGYIFDAFFDGKFHVIGNWMGFWVVHKHMVKVDKCNPEDFAGVIDKLGDIWYNLLKGEN